MQCFDVRGKLFRLFTVFVSSIEARQHGNMVSALRGKATIIASRNQYAALK
jgi:hypothetical protein